MDDSVILILYAGTFEKGTTALHYETTARKIVEPLDIANYYRCKLWINSGHYLAGENRPRCYPFFEAAYVKAYADSPDEKLESKFNSLRRSRRRLWKPKRSWRFCTRRFLMWPAGSSSGKLDDLASSRPIGSAENAAPEAAETCVLPETAEAAEEIGTLATKKEVKLANVVAAEKQLQEQFWDRKCENEFVTCS